jgi:hypothetical protein
MLFLHLRDGNSIFNINRSTRSDLRTNNKKIEIMKTLESIQMNIAYCKLELNKFRNDICEDEIQKENKYNGIEYYINELKDLKFSLKLFIKQQSI